MSRAKIAEVAKDAGNGSASEMLLRSHLVYAIEHGVSAPRDRNGNAVEVSAANILALLYGREEAADTLASTSTSTSSADPAASVGVLVPPVVIKTVLASLWGALHGTVLFVFSNGAGALYALSVSDANTQSMVDGGVLELVAEVLSKGAEIQRKKAIEQTWVPYCVDQASERRRCSTSAP